MRRAAPAKPQNRDGIWYLFRRVPKPFRELDKRPVVRLSTEIAVADDPRAVKATPVVRQLDLELHAYWRGLKDGKEAEARRRFEDAQRRARALNITYQTAGELAEGPLQEILQRVQLLVDRKALDEEPDVAAALGGEQRPRIMLSGLVAEYEAIQGAKLQQMSEKQVHRWRLPKSKAVENFRTALKQDKALTELTRQDGITFRAWLMQRVLIEGIDVGTANKDLGHISKMLTGVDELHQLNLPPVFAKLRIEGETEKQRLPFSRQWVQTKLLATGSLDGLNEEARHIVYLVADHGFRPSEAANLGAATIHLAAKVPYVSIEPIGRVLKNVHSRRDVPLTALGIAVLKKHPDGFPRYAGNEDTLSAAVNKFLRLKGLLETPEHSLYGLRHTFDDSLTAVEAPDKVNAQLMGHKWQRPKYGAGPSLEQKLRWLNKIAFKPPAHL